MPARLNKEVGDKLTETRKAKGFTQKTIADAIARVLKKESFSQRQYQKMEDGEFPQFKSQALEAVDQILHTNFAKQVYEQKVPHGTSELKVENVVVEKDAESIGSLSRSIENLTATQLVNASSIDKLIGLIGGEESNSDASADTYSWDEIQLLFDNVSREMAGKTVEKDRQIFVGYLMDEMAKIRKQKKKETPAKGKSTLHVAKGVK